MTTTVTTTMQNTAVAAAGGAANGAKNAAYGDSIISSIGSNYNRVLLRNGTREYVIPCTGSLVRSGNTIVLGTGSAPTTNLAADINTGTWVHRVEKGTDTAVYIESTLGPVGGGTSFTLSGSTDGSTVINVAATSLTLPSFDTASSIYLKQTIIDDMTNPNLPSGEYPALGFLSNGGLPPWGSDAAGDPATGSYSYIDCPIRLTDIGPSNHYYNADAWWTNDNSLAGRGTSSSANVLEEPWAVVGCSYQHQNVSSNTRVWVKNYRRMILLKTGVWLHAGNLGGFNSRNFFNELTEQPAIGGGWYNFWQGNGASGAGNEFSFVPSTDSSIVAGGRVESVGQSMGSMGLGTATNASFPLRKDGAQWKIYKDFDWHLFPLNGLTYTRAQWESLVEGTFVCMEACLILHDPNGTDDRANSTFMINIGTDFFNITTGAYISAHMHSRWKQVTNTFQLYCCSDISRDKLATYMPPGFQ